MKMKIKASLSKMFGIAASGLVLLLVACGPASETATNLGKACFNATDSGEDLTILVKHCLEKKYSDMDFSCQATKADSTITVTSTWEYVEASNPGTGCTDLGTECRVTGLADGDYKIKYGKGEIDLTIPYAADTETCVVAAGE